MKRLKAAALALSAALSLGVVTGAGAAAADQPITLEYMTWATGAAENWIKQDWIEPFEKTHPNIKIHYQAYSFGTFWDKLPTMIAAGIAPDVIHMSVAYVYDYAKKGYIRDLQPWFDRDLDPKDYFMEPARAERYPTMSSGDLYGIPFGIIETGMYYNKDLFRNAGVSMPNESWTWQTARTAAKKLTLDVNSDGKIDQYGIEMSYGYNPLDPIIHSFGGATISDDMTQVLLDKPAAESAVQFMVDLIWKDHVAPPMSERGAYRFQSGKLGMHLGTIIDAFAYREQAKFDWDVALYPKGPAKRVMRVWPDSFAIPTGSKHAEAAWEFIKFVINQQKVDRYNAQRKIPFNRQLATSPAWLERGKKPNKLVFIKGVQYGEVEEFRPNWSRWLPKRDAQMRQAFDNKIPVKAALGKAADEIRAVLADG